MSGGGQQGASGRMGAFTSSSSSELPATYKKNAASSSIQKGGRRWRPNVFDFKSGANTSCPTCQGTGHIPKGQEDELVALIPYNDKRLKPRRTCLYMSILVGLLLVCGALLTAFLYPRNVTITIVVINSTSNYTDVYDPSEIYVSGVTDVAILEVETTVEVKNSNFFPVWVSSMNVSLSNYQNEVGCVASHPFSVKSRSSQKVSLVQNATFTNGPARRAKTVCTSQNWQSYYIYLEAMVVLSYSYLSHDSNAIDSKVQKVDCRSLHLSVPAKTIPPPTIAPETYSHTAEWL